MPDLEVDHELSERPLPPSDRPAINDALGYHPYVESEFPEGAGHCDKCGGGPDAEIHQKPVDQAQQLERIADALERIADHLEGLDNPLRHALDINITREDL